MRSTAVLLVAFATLAAGQACGDAPPPAGAVTTDAGVDSAAGGPEGGVPRDAGPDGAGDAATADAPASGDGAPAGDGGLPGIPDGSLWVADGDCPMGHVGATFMQAPAFCQPPDAVGWGYYQCDELANRFMRDVFHHPDLDNVVTEFAASICQHASTMPAYSAWGPGYGATAGRVPQPGDLVVFSGSPGHVAVIAGFSAPDQVTIVQQNQAPVVDVLGWDATAAFFSASNAECWVHAEPAPPAPLPSGPSCGCFVQGPACGLAVVDYAWWNGCSVAVLEAGVDYNALYDCDAGVFTQRQACTSVCVTSSLADAGGACAP